MKKLTVTFVLLIVLGSGFSTPSYACGQQHVERCLAGPASDEKVDPIDTKFIVLRYLPKFFRFPVIL